MRRALSILGVLLLGAAVAWAAIALWDTTVPGDLKLPALDPADHFESGALREAESYTRFSIVVFLLAQVAAIAVLFVYVRRGPGLMRKSAAGPLGTGFFLGMVGTGLVWMAQLPFEIAELAWARDHDIVRTNYLELILGGWLGLGGRFVGVCVTLAVAMGLAKLVRNAWWVPAAIAFALVTLVLAFVAPLLLSGLEKPSPALRQAAERIAAKEGVHDVPLRVQPIRDLTPTPNAYAVGLGPTRKVVLWDTITFFPPREVRTAIAHEYGHQARHHILKEVIWYLLIALPSGLVLALVLRRRGGIARPEAIPLALLVFTLVSLAALPVRSAVSRHYEAEADWEALQVTRNPGAFAALFRDFARVGADDPDPPGWFHWLADDHPSALERIAMARAWAERNGKVVP